MAIKFNRRLRTKVVVDMAPMIDIVFQLVIFFMLATTFKTTSGMELELPNAKNVNQVPENILQISILNKNNILVGDVEVTLDNLETILSNIHKKSDSNRKSILLSGSSSMEYQILIDVMDILKENGYDSINLAIDRKKLGK